MLHLLLNDEDEAEEEADAGGEQVGQAHVVGAALVVREGVGAVVVHTIEQLLPLHPPLQQAGNY